MKKGDFFIIAAAVISVIISCVFAFSFLGTSAATVIIKQNNELIYKGNLNSDREISLKTNTVIIENGEVYMKDADCKNQICVKHKKISKKGESITCLPNRVLVEVE